tara:strand:- start:3469 stop:5595 length:2127 start_codon:yes stop_codon:yes gene_type:complete
MGSYIPPENGILINLTYSELTSSEICIENPIFTSLLSEEYNTDAGSCFSTGQENFSPTLNILEPQEGIIMYSNDVIISLLTTDPNNIGYHYHLDLDGENIGMFYENYFTLENLSWGNHTLTVTLADSAHVECQENSCSQSVNFTLEEPSPETIELSILNVDPASRSFIINVNSSTEFNSFDFDLSGVIPIEIMSENLDIYDFAYNIASNSVNGVSITNTFPNGENHLLTLNYTDPSSPEICIENATFMDTNNIEMIVSTECVEIILPVNEYYIPNIDQTGVSQLIHFGSAVEGLQPGDEIGIFDSNGITEIGAECNNLEEGEILVGAGIMLYDEISIHAIGSVNMCNFGGFVTPGYNLGNPIKIKVYRPSTMIEYEAEIITFTNGSGTFTELYSEVTSLLLTTEITNNSPIAIIDQNQVETYRNTDLILNGSGSFDSNGNITSYEWYLNGEELIGSGQSLTYQFSNLGDYIITLVVTDNEGAIGSVISVINVINQLPTVTSLLSPDNGEILYVEDYESDLVVFSWSESIDLDSDNLTYRLNLWKTNMPDEHNIDINLYETFVEISYNSDYLNLELDMNQNYSWSITALDGYDEIVSTTNSFEISFSMDSINRINPNIFSLSQNYPNPFNPNTEIQFNLNKSEIVTLDIYNISGKHITQLINCKLDAGIHSLKWNAKDNNGIIVPAGIYIYKLNSKSNDSIQRIMTLLK